MENYSVDLIAAELGWGAQLHETALAPQVLHQDFGIQFNSVVTPTIPYAPGQTLNYPQRLHEVLSFTQKLSEVVSDSVQSGHFPIIIGGDHAMAIGTWSGVVSALPSNQAFGLIWIDAHMDAHTPETSPSMAIHGMPLAALLGHGEKCLVELGGSGPKLDPCNVVLIGVRSYESGEAALLKQLNVKIYFIDEVKQRGFASVMKEAMEYVSANTQGFGVSLDLDAFDPLIAPGVGSPAQDGIRDLGDITEAFKFIRHHPRLMALEIAEYNPIRDCEDKTAELIKLVLTQWQTK